MLNTITDKRSKTYIRQDTDPKHISHLKELVSVAPVCGQVPDADIHIEEGEEHGVGVFVPPDQPGAVLL